MLYNMYCIGKDWKLDVVQTNTFGLITKHTIKNIYKYNMT